VELALALLAQRKGDEAGAALDAALGRNPIDPDARFLRARILRKEHDAAGARRELVGMVTAGSDGYSVRMMLADLAVERGDTDGARTDLQIAHEFDPTMIEAVQALYDAAHREKRDADALSYLRKLAFLDQHDRKVYRLLLEGLVAKGEWAEARKVGEAAMFVDVESHAIHTLYARALAPGGNHAAAVFELESALACSPPTKDAAAIHALIAREQLAGGNRQKAREERDEALRLDPEQPDAKTLRVP
jgi:tetratricopeptide (TPR) repeat protein